MSQFCNKKRFVTYYLIRTETRKYINNVRKQTVCYIILKSYAAYAVGLVVLYPIYTIEQTSSRHRVNIKSSSRPDGTPPSGLNVGLGLAHS